MELKSELQFVIVDLDHKSAFDLILKDRRNKPYVHVENKYCN